MPNVVKGSKQERMVVVPHRPARKVTVFVLTIFLVIGGPIAGYQLGHRLGNVDGEIGRQQREQMAIELAELRSENESLRSEVALLDRSNVMDQRTNDEVQQTILDLREQVAQLEQDISFYREVMSEDLEDVGLVVGELNIRATDSPNRYNYALVMRRQDPDSNSYITGRIQVELVGEQNQSATAISLHQVSESENQKDIRLRFRNFQNIEGVLELPADFTPKQIHITGIQTAPVAKTIENRFDWQVGGD